MSIPSTCKVRGGNNNGWTLHSLDYDTGYWDTGLLIMTNQQSSKPRKQTNKKNKKKLTAKTSSLVL